MQQQQQQQQQRIWAQQRPHNKSLRKTGALS